MLQYWWLLIPLGILALMVGFFLLIVVTAMWEKRHVVVYTIPEPGQELPATNYAQQANAIASQMKYQHYGTFNHGGGKIYRVRYDFWLSPDRLTLLVVGGGKIAAFPADAVWLSTKLSDGRYLVSTDFQGEADLSGIMDLEIQRDVGVVFILDRHQYRIKSSRIPAVAFGDDPLADYMHMRQTQVERMVEHGDARYLDPMTWKHTLKGALRFYFKTVWGMGK